MPDSQEFGQHLPQVQDWIYYSLMQWVENDNIWPA